MGLYPALVVLGIYDRCTPKLASDASRAVPMLSSLAEAQAQLRSEGIALDIKTLRSTAYRYAARARAPPASFSFLMLEQLEHQPYRSFPTSRAYLSDFSMRPILSTQTASEHSERFKRSLPEHSPPAISNAQPGYPILPPPQKVSDHIATTAPQHSPRVTAHVP